MPDKKKILMLSDHALCTSGVGTQSRHLINGLLKKGSWTVRQFGAAIKHSSYETTVVNDDFIIKPVDGFGTKELLRVTLATEKPDILLIFTDPRFFIWLFEMEDEIHQTCPIAWWHVWDNAPSPKFNDVLYEGADLINCHSYLTYELLNDRFSDKVNFVPHSLPEEIFFPIQPEHVKTLKEKMLGPDRKDWFVAEWTNRNARRKRPNDLLWAWSIFLNQLYDKAGHKDAILIMHTDPLDSEGPNLRVAADMLGISENVIFSTERVDFSHMNILHNVSDVCINISYAEGFGLPTLEAMQTGTPIIALKTGGLTRQVEDHRDGTENGVALPVEFRSLVGSQSVPYIYEDYVGVDTIADAFMKLYDLGPEARRALGQKARGYVTSEFPYQKTIDDWHRTMNETIERYHANKDRRWTKVCF